ncbi:MAG: phenylalanine--tRNA ligase subunit beta [Deltaproteobacteria bacterium]|jgi:phenylalanyl-tRNA synthetase beta chain|nr:phenylalanine--tRNA ligase subunit beta [Deltaproteobacteria bacterium]
MLVSFRWLGKYIDLTGITPQALAGRLTMAGLEVEDLRDRAAHLRDVLAAGVAGARGLDGRLRVLELDLGASGRRQAVCGDPLVEVGRVYAYAPPGTRLPGGTVRVRTISGAVSQGALCSEAELGLSGDAAKVMACPRLEPGQSLGGLRQEGDWVLEIGVTANRPDALSLVGVARDLSAVLGLPLVPPETNIAAHEGGRPASDQIKVTVEDPAECVRYAGRVINGTTPGPSPAWLADFLLASGMRPVNNIVDVTNFVMLELGLPLHAFDLAKIAGARIDVKIYGPGGKFTTLDGQERTLKAGKNIMICDRDRAVGLAGIMGGLNTEVDGSTRDVFLEGANFNQATIRRTSRSLGLSTDASYRFERGLDPNGCPLALDRAAALIAEVSGGKVARGLVDVYPKVVEPAVCPFSPARCNALLGTGHASKEMARVLGAVGVALDPAPGVGGAEGARDGDADECLASLPTWRPDLTREVDLFEEVARLADFDNLPATLPKPPAAAKKPPAPYRLRQKARRVLAGAGWTEALSYSFINKAALDELGLPENHPWRTGLVPVLNPLSEEQGVLRPSVLPGLLAALRLNQYRGQRDAALFEVGAVFLADPDGGPKPVEPARLAGVLAGKMGAGLCNDPWRPCDFWDVKGAVELLAGAFGLSLSYSAEDPPVFYDPAQAAVVKRDGRVMGHLGALSERAAGALGLRESGGRVFAFELDVDDVDPEPAALFKPWSNFPGVTRDLAVLVDRGVPSRDLVDAVMGLAAAGGGAAPLEEAVVFDLYVGDKIPAGKKSLALRLFFQDRERTLTDEEVNEYFNGMVATLARRFGAELRG